MAANPVNMVDAVAVVVPRLARNRSAVLRFGVVVSAPTAGRVSVKVSAITWPMRYIVGGALVANDWVAVLNDGDRWLVLGKVAP